MFCSYACLYVYRVCVGACGGEWGRQIPWILRSGRHKLQWTRLESFRRAADPSAWSQLSSQSEGLYVSLMCFSEARRQSKCSEYIQSASSHCHWACRGKLLMLLGISVSVGRARVAWWVNGDHCSDYTQREDQRFSLTLETTVRTSTFFTTEQQSWRNVLPSEISSPLL